MRTHAIALFALWPPPWLESLMTECSIGVMHRLARLAVTAEDAQEKIAAAGAIPPLLAWLSEPDVREHGRPSGLPDLAARALDAMASNNAHTSAQIVAAGVIGPLVAMLGHGKSCDAAAGLLATLAEVDESVGVLVADESGDGASCISALVKLLVSDRTGPHENASRAIWHISNSECAHASL